MKPVQFRNKLNGEQFVCDDVRRNKQIIDGVEYLIVRRSQHPRSFLIRKDALERVVTKLS